MSALQMFAEWPDLEEEDRSTMIRRLIQTHGESIVRHFNDLADETQRREETQILADPAAMEAIWEARRGKGVYHSLEEFERQLEDED